MRTKSIIALFVAFIMLFVSVPYVYAETEGETLREVTSLSYSEQSYFTSDIEGNKVMAVSYDYSSGSAKYVITLFNAETATVTASKSYKYKNIPLESIDECEIKSDGTYALYDRSNGKSAIYDSTLALKNTGKCSKNTYDYSNVFSDNALVTNSFITQKDYAYDYYRSDFSNPINAIAFPEDNSNIYLTNADVGYIQTNLGKKFLISETVENNAYASASVYDFESKTFVSTKTRSFKGYDYNRITTGAISDDYVFFVIESDTDLSCYTTPFIWKYSSESEKNAFTVNKVNAKKLKKLYGEFVTELKNTYGINVLINKKPNTYPTYWDDELGDFYGGVINGAPAFGIYRVLNDLSGYLSYFPKNFTKEMAAFGGVKHSFDIYIDKEIIGDSAAFANRYDGFLICFATDEFSSAFIPHEFLHLIDARIDDYLEKNNMYYEEEWDKLNPKNFFYYEEQDFNEKYFASSYAMTDPREDRADTFEYLFEGYYSTIHPYSYNAVRKKAIYLTNLIRAAYPSVSKLDYAFWEKWITPYPEKIKTKSTESSVKIAWSECRTAEKYQLQQKKGSSWKTIYNGANRKYTLKNLSSGKAYTFRVRAYRLDGKTKVYSSWEYIYTAAKPKTPSSFKLSTNSKHQIVSKWKKVKICSGYQVQYARDKGFKSIIATRNVAKSSNSYTGNNFTKGKKYYVRVRSFTKNGDKRVYSAWSKVKGIKSK